MSGSIAGDWLDDTYWYVPTTYLPALLAINTSQPRIVTVNDQTVWHFENGAAGRASGHQGARLVGATGGRAVGTRACPTAGVATAVDRHTADLV
jgi:hypothetical protein